MIFNKESSNYSHKPKRQCQRVQLVDATTHSTGEVFCQSNNINPTERCKVNSTQNLNRSIPDQYFVLLSFSKKLRPKYYN